MMSRCANTGPTVPGWVRDEIRRHEAEWPLWILAGAAGAALGAVLLMGVLLWTSGEAVYYVRP